VKKRKPDEISDSADVPLRRRSQDGHLQAAMESVFRLTHGREMTPDERRVFGLASEDDSTESNPRPSRNHNARDGGAEQNEHQNQTPTRMNTD